jgi:hypothetical protein
MDVVYICRPGENEELRYSLRSLANLPYGEVWVAGDAPDWYTGNLIKVSQKGTKYDNARNNLRALCDDDRISDNVILMNDDFYIVKAINSVPTLHGGDVYDKIARHSAYAPNSPYVALLWDTLHILAGRGVSTSLDYALHVPMVMDRGKLANLLQYAGSYRILYGNIYGIGGEFSEDVKYHRVIHNGPKPYDFRRGRSPFLSSSDGTFRTLRSALLSKLFPNKSLYEA